MKELVFATRNQHKVNEIKRLLFGCGVEVKSLLDYPSIPEILEDGATFEENARKKAIAVAQKLRKVSVADDSGLCVKALGGKPGVFSARYAGLAASYKDNNRKLLLEMSQIPDDNRGALFCCVIACVTPDKQAWIFDGKLEGTIIREERGTRGFGYDPVFAPKGSQKTLAEMELDEKNKISHRAIAIKKLLKSINEILDYSDPII